jgi:hypothetical protein
MVGASIMTVQESKPVEMSVLVNLGQVLSASRIYRTKQWIKLAVLERFISLSCEFHKGELYRDSLYQQKHPSWLKQRQFVSTRPSEIVAIYREAIC